MLILVHGTLTRSSRHGSFDRHNYVAEVPSQPAPETLTETRGFWSLIATQFQGAFSDNVLRNLLLSMIVGMSLARVQRETSFRWSRSIFSLPFLIFSMLGGWLADRFSKRQVTIWTKVVEVRL